MRKALIAGLALCAAVFAQIIVKNVIVGNIVLTATSGTPPTSAVCTATSTICTAITINGDPASVGPFAGYADPSAATDPNGGVKWLAYSWANSKSGAAAIETHCAKSTDGGTTWNYVGTIFPSVTATNPTTGQTNYSSNEVVKILPVNVSGTTWWTVIRLNYWEPSGGASQPTTSRFVINTAAGNATTGPMAVASATPEYLGSSANSDSNYPINVNMQTLSSDLSVCTSFREPTLIVDVASGKLVLFLGCNNFQFVAQFTAPSPTSGSWTWTYVPTSNTFSVPADATNLCAYTAGCARSLRITENDIMLNHAGTKTVMPLSLIYINGAGNRVSTGAVVAEINTSSLPYTFVRSGGNIVVDATVTSPDSVSGGPGSSSYDPVANDGVLLAHKVTANAPQNNGEYTYLMKSLLLP